MVNDAGQRVEAETRSLVISSDYKGATLAPGQAISVAMRRDPEGLVVSVDAPWWADPAPSAQVGSTPRLWEHSAVEVFLMGPSGRYVELEMGPFGHYLMLELQAFRVLLRSERPCAYQVRRDGARWHGRACVGFGELPERPWRVSACAIWGRDEARTFAMAHPTGGEAPDFHQLAAFGEVW